MVWSVWTSDIDWPITYDIFWLDSLVGIERQRLCTEIWELDYSNFQAEFCKYENEKPDEVGKKCMQFFGCFF